VTVIDNAIYIDGKRAIVPKSLDHTVEELRTHTDMPGRGFCWIGLLRPSKSEIDAVAAEFNLHGLAVEDTIKAHQRPKRERYGDVEFIVLRPARYVDHVEVVEIGEVHVFLGPDFVITVRHAEEPDLAGVRHRLEADPDLLDNGPYAVLYAVMDQIVDDYGPVLDGLQDDIDEIEVQVFNGDPDASKRIYTLSRELIEFQWAVQPLENIFVSLREQLKERAGVSDLERAVAGGADVIGMAGGDGSQALVADVAARHGVAMVVVPAGTRNHLALDLGLDRADVIGALDAYGAAVERTVDLAEVNDRIFVNNVSLGLYAAIIKSPEYRDAKIDTTLDALRKLVGRHSQPFDLRFTGQPHQGGVHILQISNNPYGHTPGTGGNRPRLDTGHLGRGGR
jgi:Mg2+ and Co2+ transporter CorA